MSTPARIGVMLPRDLLAGHVIDFVQRAEQLGFHEVWVVEDLGYRGGIAQAAVALGCTTSIRIGVGILPAAARNVAFTAMEIATLEALHPGRLDVGIGHGVPDWMASLGIWPRKPLTFLDGYVQSLSALLRGDAVTLAEGADPVALDPSALPPTVPPIVLGVRGPRSLAVSGRVANGTVLAEPTTPEYVRAALASIAAQRPHRLVAYNLAAVDDDPVAALATVRPALQWVGEKDAAPHIDPLDIADELRALRASSADRHEFIARMPEAWVRRLALAGDPMQVRARLGELDAAGATDHVLIPVGDDPLGTLDSLARVLDPRVD
ncbi:MAG: LLM class flavin-dependent oxidoreductase [Microcella pacifica]